MTKKFNPHEGRVRFRSKAPAKAKGLLSRRPQPFSDEIAPVASQSSILVWRIPKTEKPGRLQSMRLQRVRHAARM